MGKKHLSDILPQIDSTHNIGATDNRWANIYADTLYGDGSNITNISVDTANALQVTVKNVSGGQLAKGTVVHVSPSASPPSGNVVEVIAADYDDAAKMPAIGILKETIADEAEGEAVMSGALSGIATDGFTAGDELYVGADGALTNTKPQTAGQLIQKIAVCVKSHESNGLIKIFGAGRSNDVPLPLYIDNTNQYVGIGEPSPDTKLHIQNPTRINDNYGLMLVENTATGDTSTTNTGINVKNYSGTSQFMQWEENGLRIGSRLVTNNGLGHVIFTAGADSEKMRIDGASGNVGIGETNPAEKLDLSGNIKLTGQIFTSRHSSGSLVNDNYYRVIEITGGSGRGKCSFKLHSGGGSNAPFLLKGIVNAVYANANSTLTVSFNSKFSPIKELRVVRNSTSNKTFVDIKTETEDAVVIEIEEGSSSAFAVDFTNVTTLPSGDTVETTVDVHEKVFATGSSTGTSASGQFNITADGDVGIGTASPEELLHIKNGDAGVTPYNLGTGLNIEGTTSNVGINIVSSNTGQGRIYFASPSSNTAGAIEYNHNATLSSGFMKFRTGNSERMRIDGSGNVGIGTTAPSQKLHVSSGKVLVDVTSSVGTELILQNLALDQFAADKNYHEINFITSSTSSETTGGYVRIKAGQEVSGHDNRSYLGFWTAPDDGTVTEKMRIDSTGNVGIGTTTPGKRLDIRTSGVGDGIILTTSTPKTFAEIINGNSETFPYGKFTMNYGDTTPVQVVALSNEMQLSGGYTTTGKITFRTATSEQMRLTSTGLGIGTTSPGHKLTVYTDATSGVELIGQDGGNQNSASSKIIFNGHAQDNGPFIQAINTSAYGIKRLGFFANRTASDYTTLPTESMSITNTGNVGIGTDSPNAKLNVDNGHYLNTYSSNTTQENIIIQGAGYYIGSTLYGNVSIRSGYNNSSNAADLRFYVGTSGSNTAEKMRITSSGNVGIGATIPGAKLDVEGDVQIKSANISNQENTDVDSAAAEMVAQVAIATYTAAFFDFVIKKGTNVRSGTVYACHDGTNVEFTETSTQDLGDTSNVTLSVDISSGNMRLLATVTSDDWSVKSLVKAI